MLHAGGCDAARPAVTRTGCRCDAGEGLNFVEERLSPILLLLARRIFYADFAIAERRVMQPAIEEIIGRRE